MLQPELAMIITLSSSGLTGNEEVVVCRTEQFRRICKMVQRSNWINTEKLPLQVSEIKLDETMNIINIEHISKVYQVGTEQVHAIADISSENWIKMNMLQ